jgi:hypothetical protein
VVESVAAAQPLLVHPDLAQWRRSRDHAAPTFDEERLFPASVTETTYWHHSYGRGFLPTSYARGRSSPRGGDVARLGRRGPPGIATRDGRMLVASRPGEAIIAPHLRAPPSATGSSPTTPGPNPSFVLIRVRRLVPAPAEDAASEAGNATSPPHLTPRAPRARFTTLGLPLQTPRRRMRPRRFRPPTAAGRRHCASLRRRSRPWVHDACRRVARCRGDDVQYLVSHGIGQ